ncbi:MAG: sugar ABC transporter ATP-binding protein [Lachnospiraceae bacterium]|nr:sugar ABC transporter ATP-binding protein [Lachnospiraceae bacterium]
MEQEVLRLARVTYREQDEVILQDFELNIKRGEIMGLLPLNSYGLSEFLKLICTNPPLYYGDVYFMGKKVNSWRDMKRTANRITVIENADALIFGQSVLTNIFVLRSGFRQWLIRKELLKKQLIPFLDEIGMDISPDRLVEELSVFERVVVEILRAVVAGHHVIVLREIGTVIGESHKNKLYEIIRHYSAQGISFLLISVHLEEIRPICTRTALMSNGRILSILDGEKMRDDVVDLCSREYVERVLRRIRVEPAAKEREELFHFTGKGHLQKLRLSIYRGEYLVIKPLGNRIFEELSMLIFEGGQQELGSFFAGGEEVLLTGDRRVAFLTERPDKTMLFPQMSYSDNLLFMIDPDISYLRERRGIEKSVKQELSGILGNEVFEKRVTDLTQWERIELVYARIILQKPEIVFCVQPFKGADLSTRLLIWELQELLLKKGITVAVLTMNMADALSLADRVIEIDEESGARETLRRDFGSFSQDTPWSRLFR